MTTEGNVVHYGFIEKFIETLGEKYNIKDLQKDTVNSDTIRFVYDSDTEDFERWKEKRKVKINYYSYNKVNNDIKDLYDSYKIVNYKKAKRLLKEQLQTS